MTVAELDIENRATLERYLATNFSPVEEFAVREFEVLAGGVSSRTVRVTFSDGRGWVLKQSLAKLRVEADWFSDPRRIHREASAMRVLGELTPPGSVPKLIFDDERHHVLGMEAVARPHENWKSLLLAGVVSRRPFEQCGHLLGLIHRRSRERRETLEPVFADRSFFESLRVEPYYEYAAAQEPRAAAFLAELIAATRRTDEALVHGDYSPKNVLLAGDRFVLLDHEVAHWGDPAFDVGFLLTHLLAKWSHLPHSRDALRDGIQALLQAYRDAIGPAGTPPYFGHCGEHLLGCLLARVVGRSPLEYLTADERARQREATVRLMHDVPRDLTEMIARFTAELER